MKRIIARLLIGSLAALFGVALTQAPASAATFDWYVEGYDVLNPNFGGEVSATQNGGITYCHWAYDRDAQRFQVNDQNPDGMRCGVRFQLSNKDGWNGVCYDGNGAYNGMDYCNAESLLPDGDQKIRFRTGRCDGSTADCKTVGNWDWSIADWSDWSRVARA